MIDTDKLWDDVKEELDQIRKEEDPIRKMRAAYTDALVKLLESGMQEVKVRNWINATKVFFTEFSDADSNQLMVEARRQMQEAIDEEVDRKNKAARLGIEALDDMKSRKTRGDTASRTAEPVVVSEEVHIRGAIKRRVKTGIQKYKDILHQFDEKTIAGFMLSELPLAHRKEMLEKNEYIRFVSICLQECDVQCEETHGELPGVWKKELGTATLTEEEARIMRYFADHALLDNKKTSGKVLLEEILYITGASMNDGVDGKDWTPNCITSLVDKLPACFEFEIHKEWNTSLRRQRQTVRWIKLKYTPQNI